MLSCFLWVTHSEFVVLYCLSDFKGESSRRWTEHHFTLIGKIQNAGGKIYFFFKQMELGWGGRLAGSLVMLL